MKAKKIYWILALLLASLIQNQRAYSAPLPSQARKENESYEQAWARYWNDYEKLNPPVSPLSKTAYSARVPFDHLDLNSAPSWDSLGSDFSSVQEIFENSRDERALIEPGRPDFLRRLSWLYPDDGCFARTALTGQKLESWHYPRPAKLFIFGNLQVRTPNSPRGWVSWWYHVISVIAFQGRTYVFDPAIEPGHPLLVLEWIKQMATNPKKVSLSLCNGYAYEPGNLCYESTRSAENQALSHQIYFLQKEWNRVLELRRDPKEELGEHPPWLAR